MSRYHRYHEQEEQDGGVVTPLEAETETEWVEAPRSVLLNMTCDPTIEDDYGARRLGLRHFRPMTSRPASRIPLTWMSRSDRRPPFCTAICRLHTTAAALDLLCNSCRRVNAATLRLSAARVLLACTQLHWNWLIRRLWRWRWRWRQPRSSTWPTG